jgi:hypothetical protein
MPFGDRRSYTSRNDQQYIEKTRSTDEGEAGFSSSFADDTEKPVYKDKSWRVRI